MSVFTLPRCSNCDYRVAAASDYRVAAATPRRIMDLTTRPTQRRSHDMDMWDMMAMAKNSINEVVEVFAWAKQTELTDSEEECVRKMRDWFSHNRAILCLNALASEIVARDHPLAPLSAPRSAATKG